MTAKHRTPIFGLLALATLATVAVGVAGYLSREESAAPPRPVVVQLDWVHGSDFAGFYAADQKGMFAEEGLAVSFLTGGPGSDPVTSVLEGRAQLGTASASHLLLTRAQGKPVRTVACIFQRSPCAFATLAGSDSRRHQEFHGPRSPSNR